MMLSQESSYSLRIGNYCGLNEADDLRLSLFVSLLPHKEERRCKCTSPL